MATQGGGAGLTKSQLLALLFGDPAGSAAPVTINPGALMFPLAVMCPLKIALLSPGVSTILIPSASDIPS